MVLAILRLQCPRLEEELYIHVANIENNQIKKVNKILWIFSLLNDSL